MVEYYSAASFIHVIGNINVWKVPTQPTHNVSRTSSEGLLKFVMSGTYRDP